MGADGSVTISTELDDTKLKSALAGLGKTVTVGLGAAIAAFGALSVKALNLGGDLEQSVGGIETLFKNSADAVISNAEKAYLTAGVSANDYMQQVTSFSASLLQSLGGDTEAAARVADMAVIDMADNANKMGSSVESIQAAYQGFAKQNYTMLDNLKLGYGGTKTEMERLLVDAERLSGVKYDISNLNDVYQAIHVIQEELGITGTTAKEGMETLTGSIATTKAAMDNFLSGAGDVDDFVSSISNLGDVLIKNISEMFPRLTSGISEAVNALAPKIPAILNALLPPIVEGGVALITGLVNAITDNLPMLIATGKKIVIALANGLTDIVPMLEPVAAAITFLVSNIETIARALVPAVAAFVAFKAATAGAMAISTLSKIITAATAAMQLYAAGANMATVAQISGATASKILGTVMAVLTGKITLASIAQGIWNAVMLANPVGLVIAGVVALGVAIAGAIIWMNRQSAEAERLAGELEAVETANSELQDSIQSSERAHNDNVASINAEATANQNLVDQLYKLANGEAASAESKARIVGLVNTLNSAMPQLNLLYDEQTNTLNREKGVIDDLVASQQTRLLLQAHEERAIEVAKERVAIEEQLSQAIAARAQIEASFSSGTLSQKEYNALMADSVKLEGDLTAQRDASSASFDYHTGKVAEAEAATKALSKAMTSSGESIDEIAEKYGTTADAIRDALDDAGGSLDSWVAAQEVASEDIKKALEAQQKKAADVYKDITTSTDKYAKENQKSLAQVEQDMLANIAAYKVFNENITALSSSLSADSIAYLAEMGPGANQVMADLIAGGEGKMAEFDTMISEAMKTSGETAGLSLEESGLVESADKTITLAGEAIEGNPAIADAINSNLDAAKSAAQSRQNDLVSVGENLSEGLAQGILNRRISVISAAEAVASAAKTAAMRALDEHSPSKEMEWVGEMFDLGLAGGILDNKGKPIKAAEDVAKAVYSAATDYLDEQKYYGKLTLREELSALRELEGYFADYGEQRKEIARDIYRVEQEISKNVADIQKDYIKKVENLQNDYFDAVEKRASQIAGSFNLFDEIPEPEFVSGDKLLGNLKDQASEMEDWIANIAELAERGIDEGLLKELREMGPKANAELEALLSLSPEQMAEYSDTYAEMQRLANEQAILELEDLRVSTNAQIIALADETAISLGEESPDAGRAFVNGIISGISDKFPTLMDVVRDLAGRVIDITRNSWGVSSPSKVSAYLAEMLGEGFVVGIGKKKTAVVRSAKDLSDSVKGQMQKLQATISADKFAISASGSAAGSIAQPASVINVAAPNVAVQNNLTADEPTRGFFQLLNARIETVKYLDGGAPA